MKENTEVKEDVLTFEESNDSYQVGMISLDDEFAQLIGFTSAHFEGYLWRPETVNEEDKHIVISLITSKFPGQGNLWNLFKSIESMGYSIVVPTPSKRMEYICAEYGFDHKILEDPDMGRLEAMYYATEQTPKEKAA